VGTVFDLKRPRKLFQDFFSRRTVPDPEFKLLDVRALGAEHPSDSTDLPEKRENTVSKADSSLGA
jgi:hypothetical protein